MYNPNQQPNPDQNHELENRFTKKLGAEPSLNFVSSLQEQLPELELYLVGGMVRDIIIDHPAPKDYDFIARGVEPTTLIKELKKLGKCDLTGRNFGVIKFRPNDADMAVDEFIDIAFPRLETAEGTGGYRDFNTQIDHNLPIEQDLARRDLTMNALAWDLTNKQVIDPYQGLDDLEKGVIRAVGEPQERFQEDYSRMLRAIRFACKFNFDIEENTWRALTKLMPHINNEREITKVQSLERKIALATTEESKSKLQKNLERQIAEDPEATILERVVPAETINKELLKALGANPLQALDLLDKSGALEQLMPELLAMKGCRQPEKFHSEGDVWTHMKMMLEKLQSPEFNEQFPNFEISGEFVMAILLHDAGKPATQEIDGTLTPPEIHFYGHAEESVVIAKRIGQRLKLPKETIERLTFLAGNHMFAMSAPDINQISAHKFAKRFIDSPHGEELLVLLYLDSLCSLRPDGSAPMQNVHDAIDRVQEIKEIRAKQPEKIIDGELIKKILTIKAGPFVGTINMVLNELVNRGVINNEKQARDFLSTNKNLILRHQIDTTPENREEIADKIIQALHL